MKIFALASLAVLSACSYLPFIEREAEEIIEYEMEQNSRMPEYDIHAKPMKVIVSNCKKPKPWFMEESEEAQDFKDKFIDHIKENPYALRIRPKKWPWGIC